MSLQVSTGLRNALLGTYSLAAALNLGFIKIYTGTPPATADMAATGTLLVTISNASSATGLTSGAAASGTLPKTTSEVWSGVNAVSGTAGYMRYVAPGDDGTASATQMRLQGTVGVASADLILSSVNLSGGAVQGIDTSNITLPTY
jgi:hypothetical protein